MGKILGLVLSIWGLLTGAIVGYLILRARSDIMFALGMGVAIEVTVSIGIKVWEVLRDPKSTHQIFGYVLGLAAVLGTVVFTIASSQGYGTDIASVAGGLIVFAIIGIFAFHTWKNRVRIDYRDLPPAPEVPFIPFGQRITRIFLSPDTSNLPQRSDLRVDMSGYTKNSRRGLIRPALPGIILVLVFFAVLLGYFSGWYKG